MNENKPHRKALTGPRRLLKPALRLSVILGTIALLLWSTGCMERLFYIPTQGPTPPPPEFPSAESVYFASADGTRLHGWFIPAKEEGDALPPTILHLHGNAGNIESHLWFTEYLPAAGFNLFIIDYRGYGESEGSPRKRNQLIADSAAALDVLLTRDDVDANRIGLFGQSLGGAIGLNLMADRSEIRAAVIESSFIGWREMAANAVGGSSPGPIAKCLAWLLIPNHRRPIDACARLDRPYLVLHGTADRMIPFDHGRRLAEAGGANATLHPLPGGDHNTLRSTHPEIESLTIDFFHRHLPATENPPPGN